MYVRTSGRPLAFFDFMSVSLVFHGLFWTGINALRRWNPTLEMNTNIFTVWGSSVVMHLSPKLGTKVPQWGPVEHVCPSVSLFLCLSVCGVICLAFWWSFSWIVEFKLNQAIVFSCFFINDHWINLYIYIYIYYIRFFVWKMALNWQ